VYEMCYINKLALPCLARKYIDSMHFIMVQDQPRTVKPL